MDGRQIAILGERGVGKTHLQTFLRERRIPATYQQTMTLDKMRSSRIQIERREGFEGATRARILLKGGFDVPGSADAVEAWSEAIKGSAIILYLFRADLIYNDDERHRERVIADCNMISEFLDRSGKTRTRMALVGTHYDRISGFSDVEFGTEEFWEWQGVISQNPCIKKARSKLAGSLDRTPSLVVGSMKTQLQTSEIAFRVFAKELKIADVKETRT